MEDLLTSAGLNEGQAAVYIYLLDHGESAPPTVARGLSLTRSNAYKILDSLADLGLAVKTEVNKKFVYKAEDPLALTALVARERDRVTTLEQNVRGAMYELRKSYEKNTSNEDVRTYKGEQAIKGLYLNQAKLAEPVYAITSPDAIKNGTAASAGRAGVKHHGAIPYTPSAATYSSPVEWSVCGDELLIIDFSNDVSAIHIRSQAIATAFKELWQLIDANPPN